MSAITILCHVVFQPVQHFTAFSSPSTTPYYPPNPPTYRHSPGSFPSIMAPLELQQLTRGDGYRTDARERGIERGNPPRVFRTRFTRFHFLFQTINIRKPGHMIAALSAVSTFSLIATILFFMLARFEKRAVLSRRRRLLAAPMFALRLLFLYALVLVVDVMNIWIIFAVAVGHTLGWWLYFVYINECFRHNPDPRPPHDGNDSDGGGGKNHRTFEHSSVSSQSSDQQRPFWDLA